MYLTSFRLLLLSVGVSLCALTGFAQSSPAPIESILPPAAVTYDLRAWKQFVSTSGRFSVSFPGTPTEQTGTTSSNLGTLELHTYAMAVQHQGTFAVCYVAYNDLPVEVTAADQIKRGLDGGRDRIIAKNNGKLISEAAISVGGYAGREIKIDMSDHMLRGRMFIVRNRIYQVVIEQDKESDMPPPARAVQATIAERFLSSFKLLNQPA